VSEPTWCCGLCGFQCRAIVIPSKVEGEPDTILDVDHKCLRDEFAMAALATIAPDHVDFMADRAYQIADAMLAARKSKATDAKIAAALADAAQARVEGMKK